MSTRENRRSVDRLAVDLFARRRAHLLRIARRHSRREADVQDAIQEAFAEFIATYDPDRGAPPLAWLTLTLKRICWKLGSTRAREYESPVLDEILAEDSLDPGVRVPARDEARRRLGALKRDERRALVMHAAGFTYREIGEHYGWSYRKVHRCLYEGRQALEEAR